MGCFLKGVEARNGFVRWVKMSNESSTESVITTLTFSAFKYQAFRGGAVAEWSKALLERENKRSKKIPGLPPGLGKKKFQAFNF